MTNVCIALALTMGTLLLALAPGTLVVMHAYGIGRLVEMLSPDVPMGALAGLGLCSILLFLMFYWILIRPERKHP